MNVNMTRKDEKGIKVCLIMVDLLEKYIFSVSTTNVILRTTQRASVQSTSSIIPESHIRPLSGLVFYTHFAISA